MEMIICGSCLKSFLFFFSVLNCWVIKTVILLLPVETEAPCLQLLIPQTLDIYDSRSGRLQWNNG